MRYTRKIYFSHLGNESFIQDVGKDESSESYDCPGVAVEIWGRIWHKVNFEAELNWSEFRVLFHLIAI